MSTPRWYCRARSSLRTANCPQDGVNSIAAAASVDPSPLPSGPSPLPSGCFFKCFASITSSFTKELATAATRFSGIPAAFVAVLMRSGTAGVKETSAGTEGFPAEPGEEDSAAPGEPLVEALGRLNSL